MTGVELDVKKANSYLDIKIDSRIGSDFFNIHMDGKDIIVEIGFFGTQRKFRPLVRSNVVSVPKLIIKDEFGIAEKLFESGIPYGY